MGHMQADQETIESTSQEVIQPSEEKEVQEKATTLVMEEEKSPERPALSSSEDLKTFLASFHEIKESEEKIRRAIDFMRERLSLTASPRFREFWEVRKLCLPLFKETISPKSRAELWGHYVDLSIEARRLKEILDEQSAFAYEQIDLAVQSLVSDLASYEASVEQMPDIALLTDVLTLSAKKEEYNRSQKELQFLNAFAAKVNGLRKEIIKTDMRIRSKNKLFEKLSECGDLIFPKRKELIKSVSESFIEDVSSFVSKHFMEGRELSAPLHMLREEIKTLQSIAKVLTLNTHSFTETRLKLSNCWDVVKEKEKEKKKEFNEKRAVYQQNLETAEELVKPFEELCLSESDLAIIEKSYEELIQSLKGVELGRFEQRAVREKMDLARKPHDDKKALLVQEQQEKEKLAEEARVLRVQEFRLELQEVLDAAVTVTLEELLESKAAQEEKYKALSTSKAEKALLDRMFKQFKDKILEAKERSLLSLSDDEQKQYEGLKQVLKEKKERRAEMKAQLESYRKALGGSGFDFEKAMAHRDLMEVEKEALEKIDSDIEVIEGKIEELQE